MALGVAVLEIVTALLYNVPCVSVVVLPSVV